MSASYTSKLRSRKRKLPPPSDTSSTDNDSITHQPRKKRRFSETPNTCSTLNSNTTSNTNSNSHQNNDNHDDEDYKSLSSTPTLSSSTPSSPRSPSPSSPYIQFDIRSWCWMDSVPFKSYIKVTNNATESKGLKIFDIQKKRGHRIVVIDGITGNVEQSIVFDTWADIYSGVRLSIFLKTLQFKPNKWVIIITHDSGYNINTEVCHNYNYLFFSVFCG